MPAILGLLGHIQTSNTRPKASFFGYPQATSEASTHSVLEVAKLGVSSISHSQTFEGSPGAGSPNTVKSPQSQTIGTHGDLRSDRKCHLKVTCCQGHGKTTQLSQIQNQISKNCFTPEICLYQFIIDHSEKFPKAVKLFLSTE